MIEKMKFLTITGPKGDIDRMVGTYLSKYEIHLENALSELTTVQNLTPYFEVNPYREDLNQINQYYSMLDHPEKLPVHRLSIEEALNITRDISQKLSGFETSLSDLENKRNQLTEKLNILRPFRPLAFNLSAILNFQFIHYRFGRIEKEYFQKFEKYVYENLDTIFYRCHSDDQYIWGVYFAPSPLIHKIDAVFSSMHFERIYMPDEYNGTAEEAYQELTRQCSGLEGEISAAASSRTNYLTAHAEKIACAKYTLDMLSCNFDVRKVAACTHGQKDVFYILCGWMTEKDAAAFQKDIEKDEDLLCIIEDHEPTQKAPTKLKNPKLFQPFEMFVRMYGLPAYNEMDPTWFVALTYSFIFGTMFGDVGQGLCLIIGGAILYKTKKLALAAILRLAGVFSVIFGFMYGSFFGFEDLIPAIWLKPKTDMMTLPFIGTMNTVFVVAIAFGMFMILVTMIFHIINAFRAHDTENKWFNQNAVAGFVFYAALVTTIVLFMTGHTLPATAVLVIMFVIPLLIIMLKEPLTRLIQKKSPAIEGSKGMFFVQSFFELFEVMLTYFSNTLSFVRMGAFAVSHAAMMEVVLMLAGATSGDNINWIVIVLGNIFVCGMEGLIVGIQVLRLEYYEMFSRFYKGNGREFHPFIPKETNTGTH